MKNSINNTLRSAMIALTSAVVLVSTAQADLLAENQLSIGLQGNGPSFKIPVKEGVKSQFLLSDDGTLTAAHLRGLRTLVSNGSVDIYSYGSVALWSWDGGLKHDAEMVFGGGLGVGLDYDIRHVIPKLLAVFVSVEVGANFVSFDNYKELDMMSLALGVHYQF